MSELARKILSYRFESGMDPKEYKRLYRTVYFNTIRDYSDKIDGQIPSALDSLPEDTPPEVEEAWRLWRAWLSRKRGEWYRTSCSRIVQEAKDMITEEEETSRG